MIIKQLVTGNVLYDGDGSGLRGCDLSHSDMSGSDLSGSDMSGSDLSHSNLRGCDLSDCNLRRSNLRGCDLSGTLLTGVIGDGNKIHTMQTTQWDVVICLSQNIMVIGCEQHSINDWVIFKDSRIALMDEHALSFWKNWKSLIFQYIELIRQTDKD